MRLNWLFFFFFFNDTATTEIYTLSLHDALPIFADRRLVGQQHDQPIDPDALAGRRRDRKSTRLNSSHVEISYAVFCLKKKKKITQIYTKQTDTLSIFNMRDCTTTLRQIILLITT